MITKDYYFVDSHHIKNIPERLLIITTGNIKNKELYNHFSKNPDQIIDLFKSCNPVEMDNLGIIGHETRNFFLFLHRVTPGLGVLLLKKSR